MVRSVYNFFTAAQAENATMQDKHNWATIQSYYTIKPLLTKSPITPDNHIQWYRDNITLSATILWPSANKFVRQVPLSPLNRLPPAFTNILAPQLERKASQWYLNRLPMGDVTLRNLNPTLSTILSMTQLSDEHKQQLETTLYHFL